MAAKLENLTKLLIPFENKWVALSSDRKRVVDSHAKLKELNNKLEKMNYTGAILLKVPSFDRYFSP